MNRRAPKYAHHPRPKNRFRTNYLLIHSTDRHSYTLTNYILTNSHPIPHIKNQFLLTCKYFIKKNTQNQDEIQEKKKKSIINKILIKFK